MKSSEIQYYSSLTQELRHTQVEKAEKLVELERIQYNKEKKYYECLPIEGYNKTTYVLQKDENDEWTCTCQGYATKKKKGEPALCSHILALHYHWDKRNKENGWGRYKQETLSVSP